MLAIKKENKQGVLIITISGRLDGLTSKQFLDEVESMVSATENKVILNLNTLDYISSEGLRSVLTTAKKIKSLDGKFGLCSPLSGVKEVLEISGFGAMLGVYETEELAIANI